ncbi:MAG: asparagine synthase (glutamine-hydrolyzing) [Chloroflexi bacterium HGW-Chloroflexi-10]|nr:MAG: asparagine synthase (glutamine-hydrolyzing) [Chloroflexi bacterium HGW-Chloroflexi-10]
MCGIAGILNLQNPHPVTAETLTGMIAYLQHRGPDQHGYYRDPSCAMVSTRLSILDIAGGQQPIPNEDESLWIVYNGEVFNDLPLKAEMEHKGHVFRTQTDTEVILHLYESYGRDAISRLNGQFAIAIWDKNTRSLFLARDRVGIRPLFYTEFEGQLLFASEIKAFFAVPGWSPSIDHDALSQIFTYWAPLSPKTTYKNVFELPPGNTMLVKNGNIKIEPYWQLDFSSVDYSISETDALEKFEHLLIEAAQDRLRADVPVGAYLSGGLDSSTITAVIQNFSEAPLETFSIGFSTPQYDERQFQQQMASVLRVNHHSITCTPREIGEVFPDVTWHTETPVLRTSPAPMYLLSQLVHANHYKVVLTGEGADEILGGYDIFKEDYIRRFVARDPQSLLRPKLFQALYPEIPQLTQNNAFLQAFFGRDILETSAPFYAHHLRWSNTARTQRFFKEPGTIEQNPFSYPVQLPENFLSWNSLSQAQYIEIATFMSPYLLSAQGDRMGMANAVEGRYPFLDYRLIEFANTLPPGMKLRGLQEKWLLRKFARKLLPKEIWHRRKRPYRAPIHHSFFPESKGLPYVEELLNPAAIQQSGLFKPAAVQKLTQKAQNSDQLSEIEEMALVGILTTQLVNHLFIQKQHQIPKRNASTPLLAINR